MMATTAVVAYAASLTVGELPVSENRTKAEGRVAGKASQAFNCPTADGSIYPGYIMGNLTLPPHGIKDPESVGVCSQTFTVCSCQPKAIEVAYGDPDEPDGELDPKTAQRFLLSPGDMFRIPPGNCYRLRNHSESVPATLTWTIIRAFDP
jgi:centromere protein C